MIIERPTQQPTTERVEVCDWCGKDKAGEWWYFNVDAGAMFFTLSPNNQLLFHRETCHDAFVNLVRTTVGLKPLGGDDADPICADISCQHSRSGHPQDGKAITTCRHYSGIKA